jgi:hypothetical protein
MKAGSAYTQNQEIHDFPIGCKGRPILPKRCCAVKPIQARLLFSPDDSELKTYKLKAPITVARF